MQAWELCLHNTARHELSTAAAVRMHLYDGPIGRAMCRLPSDDVHATIDDVDVTIDDVRCVNVPTWVITKTWDETG